MPVIRECKKTPLLPAASRLELEAQIEIAIGFFGGQVAVLVGSAFAENGSMFNDPLFFSVVFPSGQIRSVEERNPSAIGWGLSDCAEPKSYQGYDKEKESFHGKASDCT